MKKVQLTLTKCALFLALFFMVFASFSQEKEATEEKPTVGLVLSGGGAKGLAYIGVIKVLEEAGIKPDIITGTSMGAIIGSLYAAGYTVEELTEINNTMDWDQLLTDQERLNKVTMTEKSELEKYMFSFPIKDRKINLPRGLIEGQHLENYFTELFWPLMDDQNFDSLPIPFHAMSVDVVSGDIVEHKDGNIVQAIRASMSIPTVFAGVELDSMLLVDGGVLVNFPVQQAIDMGADVIIGVYLGFKEEVTAEEVSGMTDLLMRATVIEGIKDARKQAEKCDVIIRPDLGGYSASDFTAGPMIQQLGEESTRKQFDELVALAKKYNLSYEPQPKITKPKKILISDIEVENVQYLTESFIKTKSGIEKGDSVSFAELSETIEYMHGTRNFRKLTYTLKKHEEEGYILVFHVKENPRAKFNLTPTYDDDLGVGVVTNWTLRNTVMPASRLMFSLNIAENPGLSLSLDKKMGKNQRWSDQLFLNTYRYKLPYYDDGEEMGNYVRNYFDASYGINYAPGLNNHFGGNIFYRFNRISPNDDLQNIYPQADFHKLRIHEWAYKFFYQANTTDDLYFPKRGVKFDVSFEHTFYANSELEENIVNPEINYFVREVNDPYGTLVIDYNWYKSFGKNKGLTYYFGIGAGINTDDPGISGLFMLGGTQYNNKLTYKNFAGYNFAELHAYNYSFLKMALDIQIIPGLYFSALGNMGNIADTSGDMFDNFGHYGIDDYIWGYNVGFKYQSILGPIQLFMSDNNKDGEVRWQFSIGFPF